MFLCRLGSLNSLEQLKGTASLERLLGSAMPSADSVGRIFNLVDPNSIRASIRQLYLCLKRNKVLKAPWHGMVALVIDGHESHSSYLRHCDGCLERVRSDDPDRPQYYHRNVTAQLVFAGFRFLLDAESQRLCEGELGCAKRLLDRVLKNYSRAFDVVVMDAIYANSIIFNKLIANNKYAIAVLKENAEPKLTISKLVVAEEPPTCNFEKGGVQINCWDFNREWLLIHQKVRVIATQEKPAPIKRQRDGNIEELPISSWFWLTTIPPEKASSQAVVEIAHSRWSIENEGFNELVNQWHADHVYKHASNAILTFWLMSMVASNVFRVFFTRNLKTSARIGKPMQHFARIMTADLYATPILAGVPP